MLSHFWYFQSSACCTLSGCKCPSAIILWHMQCDFVKNARFHHLHPNNVYLSDCMKNNDKCWAINYTCKLFNIDKVELMQLIFSKNVFNPIIFFSLLSSFLSPAFLIMINVHVWKDFILRIHRTTVCSITRNNSVFCCCCWINANSIYKPIQKKKYVEREIILLAHTLLYSFRMKNERILHLLQV